MKNTVFLILFAIILIGCKTETKQSTYNVANSEVQEISLDKEFSNVYEFRNSDTHQLLGVNFLTDTSIQFQILVSYHSINKIEGIASRSSIIMDVEIDEDENGIAYPADEYYYKDEKLWIAIRIGMEDKAKAKINFSGDKKLEEVKMLPMKLIEE